MHLTEIGQIDPRWSQTDYRSCVAFLSRLRTLALLRKAVQDLGVQNYQLLRAKYAAVQNCGYTEEEILRSDLTIIKRKR
jgi:hypothetical protein